MWKAFSVALVFVQWMPKSTPQKHSMSRGSGGRWLIQAKLRHKSKAKTSGHIYTIMQHEVFVYAEEPEQGRER